MLLRNVLEEKVQTILNKLGYQLAKKSYDLDRDTDFLEIYRKCKNYSVTSKERIYVLYQAVKYICDAQIAGDFVECGVLKGGSAMVMALTLMKLKQTHRKIYLYDTYSGMSQPTEKDTRISDHFSAIGKWAKLQQKDRNLWGYVPLEEVKRNLFSTGYPSTNLIFVKGKVEETIPGISPKNLALLRLDTDWYESTYHELNFLYPLLSKGGVLIVDDYGFWQGAREATDHYFEQKGGRGLLTRIHGGAVVTVKS